MQKLIPVPQMITELVMLACLRAAGSHARHANFVAALLVP
jgi:hypothetical protein